MAKTKRSDIFSSPKVLRKGESYIADRGLYYCYYYDENDKRKKLTSKTIEGLRAARLEVENLKARSVKLSAREKTLDSVYKEWLSLKRDIAVHTKQNYTWVYEHYCLDSKLGKMKITDITNGRIMEHYGKLKEQKGLSVSTIDGLHTVINQVFSFAVKERYIPINPAAGTMYSMKRKSENKQAHPALSKEEQERLLSFIRNHKEYYRWYPIIYTFLMTGMRVGEITGLRWKDVDFDNGTISVNHSLSYFSRDGKCQFIVGRPKTKAGYRTVVMLGEVKEALQLQKKITDDMGIVCNVSVPGTEDADEAYYSDFIFLNKDGGCQHQGTLNKAFRRIIRDANVEAMDNDNLTMLPKFSCHNFRSTFITNCAMMNVPILITKRMVGHDDGRVTEHIYTTVHPNWQKEELKAMDNFFGAA